MAVILTPVVVKIMRRMFLLLSMAVAATCSAQTYWRSAPTVPTTDDIWGVCEGNGTLAAVTGNGGVLVSSDGLTWTYASVAPHIWLTSIAYGAGLWVAVGDQGTILTSKDLVTWTPSNSGTSERLNGVAQLYGNEGFEAVGESGTVLTSVDGMTWTSSPSGFSGFLRGITQNAFRIFVCGQGGVVLPGQGAGISQDTGTSQNLEAIVYTSGLSVPSFEGLAGGKTIVAVGDGGTILYNYTFPALSPEGGWIPASAPATTATFRGLAYGQNGFVAAGDNGTLYTSADGYTWVRRFSGESYDTLSTANLLEATFSDANNRYIVVGMGGTILVSDAPGSQFVNISTRGMVSKAQPMIGGFVVVGSGARSVLLRAVGPALATFGVSNALPDPVLTVYDSSGAVVASNTGWSTNGNGGAGIAAAAAKAGAFALPNPGNDSALLMTLAPGAYTASVSSAGGNSGAALFEAYEP